MKRITLLLIALSISYTLFSQQIIENPKHGLTTAANLKVTSVELTDSVTMLAFRYSGTPGTWIKIPEGSCIQPVGSEHRLYIANAEGIAINKEHWIDSTGIASYKLFFQAIDPAIQRIDFVEEDGTWAIYDIRLTNEPDAAKIDVRLQDIWFDASGNKLMVIALYDTVAVYKSQLWAYGAVEKKGKLTRVQIINDERSEELYFQSIDEHSIKMGADKKKMVELHDWPIDVEGYLLPGDDPYTSPIIQPGTATFSGFIRNYTARAGFTTGMMYLNNALAGNQESYVFKIQPNGYFTVSIPMTNPEEVLLRIPVIYRSVFLAPGKETFVLVDGSNAFNGLLYQGEMAPVNNGLVELKEIDFYNYWEARDSILKMNPEQYKTYYENIRDRELQALQETVNKKFISQKAVQVKEKSIRFNCMERLLSYKMNYEGEIRRLEREKKEVAQKEIPKPDLSYYDFLTEEVMNDDLGMTTSIYYFFTNRLMYADFLNERRSFKSPTLPELADYINAKGVKLTDEENQLIDRLRTATDKQVEWSSFHEKYVEMAGELLKKYNDALKSFRDDPNFALWYDIEEVVKRSGGELTLEQKEMLLAAQKLQSRKEALEERAKQLDNKDALVAFNSKYRSYMDAYFSEQRENSRAVALKEKLGLERNLSIEIMNAQDILGPIVEQLSPVSEEDLKVKLAKFHTPEIAEYITYANNQTMAKVAELKQKSGYVVNQTPGVDADQLFEKMIEKFKGKVVFVDFWATWCGPCRSGMAKMKPLKAELVDEPIVFLYITNETSPETAWSNMVAEIGGEHYRVNKDEWNVLCDRFGISGIPHYILVDKEGKVAKNNGMSTYDSDAMKKLFEEFMLK